MNQIQVFGPRVATPGGSFEGFGLTLTWVDGQEYMWDEDAKRYAREDPPGIWHFLYFYDEGTFLDITVPYQGIPPIIGTWT